MTENGKKLPSKEEIEEMIAQINVVLPFIDKQNKKDAFRIKADGEKILHIFVIISLMREVFILLVMSQ